MGKLFRVFSLSFPLRIGTFLLIFSFIYLPLFSQKNAEKDSLLQILRTLPEDTNKVNVLNRLSYIIADRNNVREAIKFGERALKVANKLNFKKGALFAESNLGYAYRISKVFDKAIYHQNYVLKIASNINDSIKIAESLRELGIIYRNKGDFSVALDFFLKALNIYEVIGKQKSQANTLASIGALYYRQKKYKKSIEFFNNALVIHKRFKRENNIASDYNNLGNVYNDLGDYEKALYYYNNYKKIKEKLSDDKGVAIALSNIGGVYIKLKKFQLAIDVCTKSLMIRERLGLHKSQLFPLSQLSQAYFVLKDYKKAIKYGLDALKISEEIGAKQRAMNIAKSLSDIYQETGYLSEALFFYQKHKAYTDSVFNEKKSEQIAEMETKYDTEKKEQENKYLKLQDVKNKALIRQSFLLNIVSVIGVVLLMVLAVVLYRSNLRKQRTNRVLLSQKQEIEIQTEEILAQRDMLEEQHKDIRDSINYARKIQTAILPLPEEISAAFPEHFLFYQPRDIVSGDFYWFAEVKYSKQTKYVLSVSDCTGHGVPGAFMSMIGNDLLNDIVKDRRIIQPDIILNHLHEGVRRALHQETGENTDGMDISLCVIDPQEKTLSYAGANSPLVYVQDGEQTRIAPNKTSIGGDMSPGEDGFQAHTISYQEAPIMCYMYSDGYRDQFGGKKGKKFMRSRFLELVFYISQLSMQDQRRQVEETINDWMKQGGYEQMDDMLVMGFRLS
ncbi:MAG TPA: hypothetical protein DCS93_20100 [Microscillaceae bacterium]|nr:hypothetical protein [Microscillaceae bacterium]